MRKYRRNPLSVQTAVSLATLAAIGGAGYLVYSWLKKNPGAFNPMSDKNLAYQGANNVLRFITGNEVDSVGTAVANVFPSSAEQKVDAMLKGNAKPAVLPGLTIAPYSISQSKGRGTATDEPLTTETAPIF